MFHALTPRPDPDPALRSALHFQRRLTETKNCALGSSRQLNPLVLAFDSHFYTAVLEHS